MVFSVGIKKMWAEKVLPTVQREWQLLSDGYSSRNQGLFLEIFEEFDFNNSLRRSVIGAMSLSTFLPWVFGFGYTFFNLSLLSLFLTWFLHYVDDRPKTKVLTTLFTTSGIALALVTGSHIEFRMATMLLPYLSKPVKPKSDIKEVKAAQTSLFQQPLVQALVILKALRAFAFGTSSPLFSLVYFVASHPLVMSALNKQQAAQSGAADLRATHEFATSISQFLSMGLMYYIQPYLSAFFAPRLLCYTGHQWALPSKVATNIASKWAKLPAEVAKTANATVAPRWDTAFDCSFLGSPSTVFDPIKLVVEAASGEASTYICDGLKSACKLV